eukprot:g15360.t1
MSGTKAKLGRIAFLHHVLPFDHMVAGHRVYNSDGMFHPTDYSYRRGLAEWYPDNAQGQRAARKSMGSDYGDVWVLRGNGRPMEEV